MYKAEILADSIMREDDVKRKPVIQRLTTFEVTFPRFILAEVNTHRMLSRNSASSRAIPTEKIIDRVRANCFVPAAFNQRVKGMGVGEPLEEEDLKYATDIWKSSGGRSAHFAELLAGLNVDKSRANRVMEPYMWHTAILTATDWDNFFNLRAHPEAQPEFQILAKLMMEEIAQSTPKVLNRNDWHTPLYGNGYFVGGGAEAFHACMVSAGRCARSSYDLHMKPESEDASIGRAKGLIQSGHMSPMEHQGTPMTYEEIYAIFNLQEEIDNIRSIDYFRKNEMKRNLEYSGNFKFWTQYRKKIDNEAVFKG